MSPAGSVSSARRRWRRGSHLRLRRTGQFSWPASGPAPSASGSARQRHALSISARLISVAVSNSAMAASAAVGPAITDVRICCASSSTISRLASTWHYVERRPCRNTAENSSSPGGHAVQINSGCGFEEAGTQAAACLRDGSLCSSWCPKTHLHCGSRSSRSALLNIYRAATVETPSMKSVQDQITSSPAAQGHPRPVAFRGSE